EYDVNNHHDLDWIKHTVYSYIRLYESGELNTVHKEQWYNKHVWLPIDTVFIISVFFPNCSGESLSLASSLRKNKNRTIGSTSAIKRVKSGYK
ncbi:hypothetical protein BDB01DRAFT_709363, partial [Pilobolus umbonatus]